MALPYKDRIEAAHVLAGLLREYRNRSGVLVLGLPRGGVPVAPPEAVESLREVADLVVCPAKPIGFEAVGHYYEDFSETTDEEVRGRMKHAEEHL